MGLENILLVVGVAALTAWLVAGGRHRHLRHLRHHGHDGDRALACPCGCIHEPGVDREQDHG